MKLSRLLNLSRSAYLLPGLTFLSLGLAPVFVQSSTQWLFPHISRFTPGVPQPPVSSSLHVTWTPICRQGHSIAMEASTSAEAGPHSIHFPGREKLNAQWNAKLAAVPFPQIHGRARLSRVPVMVYHNILPQKKTALDTTVAELETQFKTIQKNGLTPIALEQLIEHLKTGIPLPEKPIVLMFDQGYEPVYPLLKTYNFPVAFAIDPTQSKNAVNAIKGMTADPLVTIVSHSLSTASDLRMLSDEQLQKAFVDSKRMLESNLGMTIPYFVYPEGPIDDRLQQAVKQAGYQAAWMKPEAQSQFVEESDNLLTLHRIGSSTLDQIIPYANGGPRLKFLDDALNFDDPVQLTRPTINHVPLILASGGRPTTIHAKTRSQVSEIITNTPAIAAVDGTFFSLEQLDSNQMIGPVLSRERGVFVPGQSGVNPFLKGRPLVLINDKTIKFIPFDGTRHNTKVGMEAVLPGVMDAFVGAGWLVRDGKPQSLESFGKLYSVNEERDRAFWGVDWNDRPVVGVSGEAVGSVKLGEALSQAGLRDVVMLDSGASASLVYNKSSMMDYLPRPVPHAVALYPPQPLDRSCPDRRN
jgi:poly-beta-1,6-N-acetyl-D-glucosamine N-deacetylase